jgi:hypothetical protein
MKYHGLTPKLLLVLLTSLVLSGCVSEKLEQRPGLLGDLFREESNCMLPPDIQIAVEERRYRYEEVNDIHNINFVVFGREKKMSDELFKKLLTLRWKLLRMNKENEIQLQEVKVMLKKYEKRPKRKLGQDICAKYDKIRKYHKEYMEQTAYLLGETDPYTEGILDKFIETWGYEDYWTYGDPPGICSGCCK